ncbi:MAG: hypothetical protein K2P74_08675 [Nitrosomonas sp.]|nr:hypothetical protein [Nitrosomonas sp.]
MAIEQNTTEDIFRNGLKAVTQSDIECNANITFEQANAMGAIFRAIERLTQDNTIKELCNHGALQADLQANDIDVLRECAVKAGVVGKLIDEGISDHKNTVATH